MLLDLDKNIYFSKSYSRKLFVIKKTQLDFFEKYFQKTFQQKKTPTFRFCKILKISIFIDFSKKWFFQKSKFWIFWKVFWKYFFKKSSWVVWSQKVFGCNFWKNKYFFTNPKAYEAACPWLPFPLLDIKNGPVHKKLSPKNLGVSF